MKTVRTRALLMGLFATLVIISCRKTDLVNEFTEDVAGKPKIVLVTEGAPIELPILKGQVTKHRPGEIRLIRIGRL